MRTKDIVALIWLLSCTKNSLDYATDSISILVRIFRFLIASFVLFSNALFIKYIFYHVHGPTLWTYIGTVSRFTTSKAVSRHRSRIRIGTILRDALIARYLLPPWLYCRLPRDSRCRLCRRLNRRLSRRLSRCLYCWWYREAPLVPAVES